MSLITIDYGTLGSTPFQFSTEEQKTNLKWIDGKPIYQTTFDMGGLTTKTLSSVGINNIDSIIDVKTIWEGRSSNNHFYTTPYYTSSTDYWNFYIQDNSIVTRGAVGQTCIHLYVTMYYTKTTD